MLSEMKKCNLSNSDLSRTNFIYANLEGSNITNSKTSETIFVRADLRDANLSGMNKNTIYLKYARLDGNDVL